MAAGSRYRSRVGPSSSAESRSGCSASTGTSASASAPRRRCAGSVSDVTARMRAEEALRLSEERYVLAMLAAEDAHWDWIVGSDQYYLSPRTLDLFGLPPDTVFTSREDYLTRTPLVREDLEKWQRAMAELFASTGSRLSMELRAVVRGEIRWLQRSE